jgi:hypothetical protein
MKPMPVRACLTAFAASLLLASPALAITAKEKRATCEFGATDQKLTGAKRKAFIARCMAPGDQRPAKKK